MSDRISPRRRKDWPQRLADYLASREVSAYAYGAHDCCRFACGGLVAQGLADPMPEEYRGYDSEAGAQRMIVRLGGSLDAAATKLTARMGLAEIAPAFAGRGCLVLADIEQEDGTVSAHLGLVDLDGLHGVFNGGAAGLVRVPIAQCRRAWRVD